MGLVCLLRLKLLCSDRGGFRGPQSPHSKNLYSRSSLDSVQGSGWEPSPVRSRVSITEVGMRGFSGFRTLIVWRLSRGLGKSGERWVLGSGQLVILANWNVRYFPLDASPPWVVPTMVFPGAQCCLPAKRNSDLLCSWLLLGVMATVWPSCSGSHELYSAIARATVRSRAPPKFSWKLYLAFVAFWGSLKHMKS